MIKSVHVLLIIGSVLLSSNVIALDNKIESINKNPPMNYLSESTDSFFNQCRSADPTTPPKALTSFTDLDSFLRPAKCAYKVAELSSPYSKRYCENINKCGNVKLKNSSSLSDLEFLAQIDLNEKLNKYLVKMELVERVRVFAELSGMKDAASKCKSRFQNSSNSQTCTNRFNNVMVEMVKTLKENNLANGREINAENPYHEFETNNQKSGPNQFNEFFKKRVDSTTKNIIQYYDDTNLVEISNILADSTKTIPEKKAIFQEYLEQQNKFKVLDPILNGMNQDANFVNLHKEFLEKTFNQPNLSKEEIKNNLIKYRENRAKEILSSQMTCNDEENFDSLCKTGNTIAKGNRIDKNITEARENIDIENKYPNTLLLSTIHNKYFPNSKPEEDNYESARMILEVGRCSMYNFSTIAKKQSNNAHYHLSNVLKAEVMKVDENGNVIDEVKTSPKNYSKNNTSSTTASTSSSKDPKDTEDFDSSAPKAKSNENFQQVSPISTSSAINTIIPQQNEVPTEPDNTSIKTTENIIASGSAKDIDKRLSDLTKRLEAANEKISNLNTEDKGKPNTTETKKIIAAENKEINELKSQIANLKKKKAASEKAFVTTAKSKTSEVKTDSKNNSSESFMANSKRATADSRNFLPQEKNSISSISSSRSPSSVSPNKQVVLDSSSRKKIEVLIDSSKLEKGLSLSDAILQKITRLNGVPFYIEEGGMLKQIIPLLDENGNVVLDKEGMPTYEKVLKGKTSEKLIAKNVKKDDSTILAPITTQADLQRSQDKLLGRSVYEKIQKITNEILGNED